MKLNYHSTLGWFFELRDFCISSAEGRFGRTQESLASIERGWWLLVVKVQHKILVWHDSDTGVGGGGAWGAGNVTIVVNVIVFKTQNNGGCFLVVKAMPTSDKIIELDSIVPRTTVLVVACVNVQLLFNADWLCSVTSTLWLSLVSDLKSSLVSVRPEWWWACNDSVIIRLSTLEMSDDVCSCIANNLYSDPIQIFCCSTSHSDFLVCVFGFSFFFFFN